MYKTSHYWIVILIAIVVLIISGNWAAPVQANQAIVNVYPNLCSKGKLINGK